MTIGKAERALGAGDDVRKTRRRCQRILDIHEVVSAGHDSVRQKGPPFLGAGTPPAAMEEDNRLVASRIGRCNIEPLRRMSAVPKVAAPSEFCERDLAASLICGQRPF